VLERRKIGRAFVYRPGASRQELESGLVTRALQPLLQGAAAEPILSFFVEEVSRHDDRLLDELERLVREKRRQQEGGR
jgi:predicted transcriptional regulator